MQILVAVGNHSLPGLFTGEPGLRGSDHPVDVFSITQISRSRFVFPGAGRFEMKNRREPSAVMNGSASEYCPEKGATSGAVHFPFSNRERAMVQKLKFGVLFTK